MAKKYSVEFHGDIEKSMDLDDLSSFYVPHKKVENLGKPRYTKIFNFLATGICVFKKYDKYDDLILINIDDATCKLIGLSNDQTRGCLFSEVFQMYTNAGILDLLKKVNDNDKVFKFNVFFKEEGNILYAFENTIFSDNGLIFIQYGDIKKREMVKSLSQKLFNSDTVGIMEIDKDENIISINETLTKFIDYSSEEISINLLNNLIISYENDNPDINSFKDSIDKLFNNKIASDLCEIKIKTKSNEEKWLKINSKVVIFDDVTIQLQAIDITDLKKDQSDALEFQDDLKVIEKFTKTAIITIGPYIFDYTSQLLDIFELDSDIRNVKELFKYINPKSKSRFIKKLETLSSKNSHIQEIGKIKTPQGNIKYISVYVKEVYSSEYSDLEPIGDSFNFKNSIFPKESDFVKSIIFLQDVTKMVLREKSLKELETSLNNQNFEKEVLLKEIHHRVKNNLQLLLSFVNIEKHYNGNPKSIISNIRARIQNIALVHEKTYLSTDLLNIELDDFIRGEIPNLIKLYNESNSIKFEIDIEKNIWLPMDFITTLSLIDNEVITNAIKYAFDEGNNNKKIFYKASKIEGNKLEIICGDNGKGLPEGMDIYNSPSLGLTIINNLISQLDGTFELYKCVGTGYRFVFDLNNL